MRALVVPAVARDPMTRAAALIACLAAAGPAAAAPAAAPLDIRFIGNEAFSISDGRTTLLSDFPYQPGYSGYMTYDMATVRPEGRVVALITHRHLDHFDPRAFLPTGWEIVGPWEVTTALPEERVVPFGALVVLDGLTIRPIRTPHRDTEHYSYLVEWGGRRLYFVGDTEDPGALLAARGLDVAFVTPWLWDTVRRSGRKVDARRIVIYHHTAGQRVRDCDGCTIPRQGERLGVAAAPAAPGSVTPAPVTPAPVTPAPAEPAPATARPAPCAAVNALGWMSGSWAGTNRGVRSEEHWTAPGGGVLLGMHRDVRDGRIDGFEFLRIQEHEGGLTYLAQPGGRPATPFRIKELGERRVVFENPDHDFPRRILYWQTSPDELRARVEGTVEGKPVSEEWVWIRSSLAP